MWQAGWQYVGAVECGKSYEIKNLRLRKLSQLKPSDIVRVEGQIDIIKNKPIVPKTLSFLNGGELNLRKALLNDKTWSVAIALWVKELRKELKVVHS